MSDLISRQDAIDAIKELCLHYTPTKSVLHPHMDFVIEELTNLPSAQPEITLESAIDYLHKIGWMQEHDRVLTESAQPESQWIPCSERLPKINQSVLLATNNGVVFIGHKTKPELIWQVTEEDGRKHWVYDPEAYTDDIESLPKGEDCAFDNESQYEDGALSVTSANYNPRFDGVVAWMPLPKPYEERRTE